MFDNNIQVFIHTEKLRANCRRIMAKFPSIMPIVKANAYGHGILQTARILEEEGVKFLAAGSIRESVKLRQNGIRAEIVPLLGILSAEEARQAAELHIMPLLHSFEELTLFDGLKASVDVVIKCDTGMGRLGFTLDEIPSLLSALAARPNIHPRIVLSHLACADEDGMDAVTVSQCRVFAKFLQTLRAVYPDLRPSLLNSAALLIWPDIVRQAPELAGADFWHDLARPGHSLYGDNPLGGTSREALGEGFLPVMEARTSVLSVHSVKKGQKISYGHTFTAPNDMKVAIIAAGYADGYPRQLSNRGYVALRGGRAAVVGRVCMQMTFADVTNIPNVRLGDPVWLLGGPEDGSTKPITSEELGRWSKMIPYEFLCSFGQNERIYID